MAVALRRAFGAAARPSWRHLALAAGLGLAVAAGQEPFGLWWLALPALAVLTGSIAREGDASRRVWAGFSAGVGYGAGALFWIVEPFLIDPWRHAWMAPFALVLMAAGMGLFWAAASAVAGVGRGIATRAAGFAVGLTAADLLRSYLFTGFPWALVGHVWLDTPVMQLGAWVGPIGLTGIAMALAALPAAASHGMRRGILTAASAAMLAALWAGGQARLDAPEQARTPPITVRLVQPDAAQHLKWRGDMWPEFLDRQMRLTAEPSEVPLNLIVWPETSVPFLLDRTGGLFHEMTMMSRGVPMALGIQRDEGTRYFNSLAMIDGSGAVSDVYDKWHLVPFGEYVPGGDFLAKVGFSAFAAQQGNGYSPGIGPRTIDLGGAGRVLPLICYEAIFPQDLRIDGERADWILQVTNDGWFGTVAGPYQHLAQARLRAVEQGLPFLRAANTGITAGIDAKGRVIGSLPLGTQGHLDLAVPARLAPTFYATWGEWPVLAGIVLAFATIFGIARGHAIDRRQNGV